MLAPVSGPAMSAQKPTVRPTARAANPPGTRSSVATAMITNMRAKESSVNHGDDDEREGQRHAHVASGATRRALMDRAEGAGLIAGC